MFRWSSPTQLLNLPMTVEELVYGRADGMPSSLAPGFACVVPDHPQYGLAGPSAAWTSSSLFPLTTELKPFRRFSWMLQPDIHKRPSGARYVLAVPTCVFRLPPQSPFLSVVPASLPFPLEPFYLNRSSRGSCSLLLRRAILLLALAVVVCVQHYDSSTWSFTSQR